MMLYHNVDELLMIEENATPVFSGGCGIRYVRVICMPRMVLSDDNLLVVDDVRTVLQRLERLHSLADELAVGGVYVVG